MWEALKSHPLFQYGSTAEKKHRQAWLNAPDQFYYPGRTPDSLYMAHPLGRYLPRSRAPYKSRRMRAFDRRAIDRLKKDPEPEHPDQLRLF